ncbi:hypothetical protein H2248_008621 [Termitomyces sp. 'cryptogamus']|nr:hypothetical protein H2248_008621 [Termitomyces sp. 'cryptogamus']
MQPRPKIRRKPPPAVDAGLPAAVDVDVDVRYPAPDPNDPFAPLWVLRSRKSNTSLASPAVAFPIMSGGSDVEHKWHDRLLRRVHTPAANIPPSTSTSTDSSFVHVSSGDDDPWALPTPSQLARAASLPVIAPSGLRVPFASLFTARPTVVVFIRHFWCPHCQDYVSSIAHTVPRPSEVNLVVVANGAPAFIPKYRALFGLEFEIYTDPTLGVYSALGMIRSASTSGPTTANGDYVRHGTMGGIATVVYRALKAGLPVWERGGDIHQLGGEFVLGPGLTCTYAHRMQSPKDHAPIRAVLSAAGVSISIPSSHSSPLPSSPSTPKLLTSLRIKGWAHQKRSSSMQIPSPNTSSPSPTPSTPPLSKFKLKPNRRKNMSMGSYQIPIHDDIPRSSSPVTEFGAWRRTGRVSFDSARALSEGARQRQRHSKSTDPQSTYPHSQSLPYIHTPHFPHTSPYSYSCDYDCEYTYPRQRQCVSSTTLPMYDSSPSSLGLGEGGGTGVLGLEDERGGGYGYGWMRARMASLEAMRERKRERRAGFVGYFVPLAGGGVGVGVGVGVGSRSPSLSGSPERGRSVVPVVGRPLSVAVGCEPVREDEEEEEEEEPVGM